MFDSQVSAPVDLCGNVRRRVLCHDQASQKVAFHPRDDRTAGHSRVRLAGRLWLPNEVAVASAPFETDRVHPVAVDCHGLVNKEIRLFLFLWESSHHDPVQGQREGYPMSLSRPIVDRLAKTAGFGLCPDLAVENLLSP